MRTFLAAFLFLATMFATGPLVAQQPPTPATNSTDSQTDANAVAALGTAKSLSNVSISTDTVNGVVTLTGVVTNDSQKELAGTVVSHAVGVKSVVNNLTIGKEQAACDPATSQMLSDGTCAPLDAAPAPAPPPRPKPRFTGPMVQIDVDQNCRVLEASGKGDGTRYQRDPNACVITSQPREVRVHYNQIDNNGKMKRLSADVVAETFSVHNSTQDVIMYLVHVPLRGGWHFDSDPPPADMTGNIGTWRVIVQPGEWVNLSVGQRHER